MKFINKGLILNVIVLSVFILSAFSLAPKTTVTNSILGPLDLCAADVVVPTDTGLACVRKTGNCSSTDFITLIDALQTDLFDLQGNNMSKDAFQHDLTKSYTVDGLYNTCINKKYNKIMTVFGSASPQAGVKDKARDLDSITGGFDVPRVCNPGTFPDAAEASVGANKTNPGWGCCPANYSYVTSYNIDQLVQSQGADPFNPSRRLSGCCPDVGGLKATYWDPDAKNGVHCVADAAYTIPVTGGGIEYPNDMSGVPDADKISIYGQPLSQRNVNSGGPYLQPAIQDPKDPNKFVCPEGTACFADPKNGIFGSSLAPDGKEKGLPLCATTAVPGSGDTSVNSSTVKCYAQGEFIGTIDSNGQKLVRKCDISSTTFYLDVAACNNSLSDELACRGSGGVSEVNYNACCNCRITGGIWTGIGCTDTTPLGLITGIIRIVFGVVGGIALLQLIIAGVMYQTGDEARIKAARESIIKTLSGLAVLVFSILILRIIGINILDILPVGSI